MSNTDPEVLVADLKASVTSEENKLIVANLALQTTRVIALAAADPAQAEQEMAHIRAAAANLAAGEAAVVQDKILAFVAAVITKALFAA